MISKARMLTLIKDFRWKDIEAGLVEKPSLIEFRDDRGRKLAPPLLWRQPEEAQAEGCGQLKTARVLLDAGLDINREAYFRS